MPELPGSMNQSWEIFVLEVPRILNLVIRVTCQKLCVWFSTIVVIFKAIIANAAATASTIGGRCTGGAEKIRLLIFRTISQNLKKLNTCPLEPRRILLEVVGRHRNPLLLQPCYYWRLPLLPTSWRTSWRSRSSCQCPEI